MKRSRKVLAVILAVILSVGMGMTAYATEAETTDVDEELTEEERMQKELDMVYGMEVQSNGIEGWPQGPGTYGEAAIVMDAGTGAILYAKNIDDHQDRKSVV